EIENDISQKDRQEILRIAQQEVLETDKYPEIRYECSSVTGSMVGEGRYWVVLSGNLTLHGVTRPQKIAATVAVNGDTCRASGDFAIRQSEYKIKLVSAAAGALKVKDDVKCTFDIMARKTEWLRSEAGVRPENTAGASSDRENRFVVRSRSRIHWHGLGACSEQSWFPGSRQDHEPPGRYR